MGTLLFRLFVNAAALWLAAEVVDGIELSGEFMDIMGVALVFGLINALIKPVVSFFALPFIILTLGLMTFVINAFMLLLTDRFMDSLTVDGFGPALIGGILISIVSLVLGGGSKKRKE